MWKTRVNQSLAKEREKNRIRQRQVCQTDGALQSMVVNEQRYLNFSSNDYLGLTHHPKMIEAAIQGAQKWGVGSGGSPHVTGYSKPLAAFEEALASWLGFEAAIVYPSGFTANQAVIKLLIEREDQIIADRLSHASLLEAAILSPGRLYRFKHNDLESLSQYLNKPLQDHAGQLVITEGVFSMDGDHAPLDQLALAAQKAEALFMVDDAHGIGICGQGGRGSCDLYGIQPDILVVTFGKAFGCSGAAVLLSKRLADYFIQFSKPLIYSTAIPPMQAVVLQAAMDLIQSAEGEQRRQQLQRNIAYFKAQMQTMLQTIASHHGDDYYSPALIDSDTPIQPLVIGEELATLTIAGKLRQQGIWVSAIRPPTVAPNTARLRITLTADHCLAMIDRLVAALQTAILDRE